jgi:branched-chain amino acid transport system substrate-binding protein
MHKSLRAVFALSILPLLGACAGERGTRIAAVLPLSGEGADYGAAIHEGMTLAAEELARQQGPAAPTLAVADSTGDPQRAVAELERLFDEGAVAAIAGVTDPEALAVAKVADETRRVVVSPGAASPELTGISRWFFRVRPSGVHDGNRMAMHVSRELDLKRVTVLAPTNGPAGTADAFASAFESQGGEIVERVEYGASGSLPEAARQAAKSGAQAVYVDGPATAVRELVGALRDARFRGRILTHSGFALPAVLAAAGSKAEGVLLSRSIFDPDGDDPAVRQFVDAFEARHGRQPGLFEAYGYDAVMTLGAALEQGTLPEAVWKGLHGLQDHRGASGAIQFDERGDVRGFSRIYVVRRGQLAAVGSGTPTVRLASREVSPGSPRRGG